MWAALSLRLTLSPHLRAAFFRHSGAEARKFVTEVNCSNASRQAIAKYLRRARHAVPLRIEILALLFLLPPFPILPDICYGFSEFIFIANYVLVIAALPDGDPCIG
jgi:hypothetical protein